MSSTTMPDAGWITDADEVIDASNTGHGYEALVVFQDEVDQEIADDFEADYESETEDEDGNPLSEEEIEDRRMTAFQEWTEQEREEHREVEKAIGIAESHGWIRFWVAGDKLKTLWLEMVEHDPKRVNRVMAAFFPDMDEAHVSGFGQDWTWRRHRNG